MDYSIYIAKEVLKDSKDLIKNRLKSSQESSYISFNGKKNKMEFFFGYVFFSKNKDCGLALEFNYIPSRSIKIALGVRVNENNKAENAELKKEFKKVASQANFLVYSSGSEKADYVMNTQYWINWIILINKNSLQNGSNQFTQIDYDRITNLFSNSLQLDEFVKGNVPPKDNGLYQKFGNYLSGKLSNIDFKKLSGKL